MKAETLELIKIYDTYEYDWMNYKIFNNDITYHHVIKEENGGELSLGNGALLTTRAHEYLHFIERTNIDIYDEINEIFKQIIIQKHAPTYKQRKKIDLLLLKFELENYNDIIKKSNKSVQKRIKMATNLRIQSQKNNR